MLFNEGCTSPRLFLSAEGANQKPQKVCGCSPGIFCDFCVPACRSQAEAGILLRILRLKLTVITYTLPSTRYKSMVNCTFLIRSQSKKKEPCCHPDYTLKVYL